jgi:DNA-binding protein HU-beta
MFSAALRRASASPAKASWVRGFASKPPGAGALGKAWAIELIKDAAGVTNKQAEASYKALLEGVASSVAKGERVTFQGFGTFEKTSRAARAGVNPQTGAAIQIPATQAPKFKAGAAFKQLVKGK